MKGWVGADKQASGKSSIILLEKKKTIILQWVITYLVSKHSFRDDREGFPDHFNLHCRHTSSPNPLRSHCGDCRNRELVRIPETHQPSHTLIAIKGKVQKRPVVSLKSYFPCSLLMGSVTDIRKTICPANSINRIPPWQHGVVSVC